MAHKKRDENSGPNGVLNPLLFKLWMWKCETC